MTKVWFRRIIHHKSIFFIVLTAVILEVAVCNYRTWQMKDWKPYDMIENNSFQLKDGQHYDLSQSAIIAPFRKDGWCDVTAFDRRDGMRAENLYLLCRYLDSNGRPLEESYVEVSIKIRDDGNELSYQLPDRTIVSKIERTQYNRLNPSGSLKGLELAFSRTQPDIGAVEILECQFNCPVPLQLSAVRFLFLLLFILLLYYLRPGSPVYLIKFEDCFRWKKTAVILVMAFCMVFSAFFANVNPQYSIENYRVQYHELTEALLDGHVYLNEEPSEELKAMGNPYDTHLRDMTVERWNLDWAYYNGKYYVYFGIVPVLVNFLPYYVLTGRHLPVPVSVSFFGFFYILGCFVFLWSLFKRFFGKAPFVYYFYSSSMLLFCSGMFYAFRGPAFYGLPILAAAAFSIWGLWFWQSAADQNGSVIRVMFGSFCIALTAGCRPQFLIVSVSALLLFKDFIFDKKYLFSKKGYKFFAALICPAAIIAAGIMFYNFIRFGSVFDFGANYNLTTNDMTQRGWHVDRTMLGFFTYLFEPAKLSAVFPFILDSVVPGESRIAYTNYMGITIFEGNFGGIVFNHPILILPFIMLLIRKYCKKRVYMLSTFFTCSAVVILFMNTQMAGLVGRYLMDFGWMLCLAAILLMSSVEENSCDRTLKIFMRTGVLVSIFWGFLYEFLLAFNIHTNSVMREFCPDFYYKVQSAVEFWL